MKSNENEISAHLNGSFAVPFSMTIKPMVISNQDCFDGEWNALRINLKQWLLFKFLNLLFENEVLGYDDGGIFPI